MVYGETLGPQYGTTTAAVITNQNKKFRSFESKVRKPNRLILDKFIYLKRVITQKGVATLKTAF